jgi:hypothetical protein
MKTGVRGVWSLQPFLRKRHVTAWRKFLASSRSKFETSQPYTRSETVFNADLREVLKAQGLGVLHVRETDTPGTYDLLLTFSDNIRPSWWVELKVMDEPLRPSQITFHRERHNESMFVMRLREDHAVQLNTRDDKREILWAADFRLHQWAETFHRQFEDLI